MKNLIPVTLPWSALMLALSLPALAHAQGAPDIVFRCTDADGEVAVQDTPCPSGSAQIIQRRGASAVSSATTSLGEAPTSPLAAGSSVLDSDHPPAPAETDATGSGEAILDSAVLRARAAAQSGAAAARPPLPVVFRCIRSDGGSYFHELEPAPARCASLAINGLGGGVAPTNAASCEVVRDTCTEIGLEQRCGAWQQRLRDARGAETFAPAEGRQLARSERLRVQAILEASDCAVP